MRQLITVFEAADRLGLKPATIRKMIFQRRLPVVRIGRAVRIKGEDVERLIEAGYHSPMAWSRNNDTTG